MGGATRSLDQQAVFLRHGISGPIDPARTLAPTVVAPAIELQDFEMER